MATAKQSRRTSITSSNESTSERTARSRSSRLRILGWILLPTAFVLALSWITTRAVLLDRLNDGITQELAGEVSELRLLADEGVDPTTGTAFADPAALLRQYLSRSIPDANETMFAVVDGVVVARTGDTPAVRLDELPDLVDEVNGLTGVTYGALPTTAGDVRYVAVPVAVEGSPSEGALVVGIFRDLESTDIEDSLTTWLLLSIAALVMATVIGWFVAGRVLAPVRQMAGTARQISAEQLGRRIPLSGRGDELDDLADSFNGMLDRLDKAFAAQRAFVDDAGHELRTPLTIIRGNLELMQSRPEEHAEGTAIALEEVDRMARIVHDLQTLTKSTQPGFVQVREVSCNDVTDDIITRAHTLADRRWVLDAETRGTCRIDRQRVTQALVQLVDNAVKHTQAGDEIGVGSELTSDEVRFWVRDTGPGIPPADRERVFDRFVSSGGDGAGLGLSIVSAIAQAHGGRVRYQDTPGGGATFFLVLPRRTDG